jgi:molecular chaperone DnaJ
MAKDFYKVLGVEKTASKDEIKKAFYKLAQQYHPDKKTGDEAKFKEVNEAYQVLSDEEKRKRYDQFGSADASGFGGGAGGFGGFDFSGFDFGGQGFDMGDIFDMFGGGGARGKRAPRGRDIEIDLELFLDEATYGVKKTQNLRKPSACSKCSGTGAKDGKMMKCGTCDGRGQIARVMQTPFGAIQQAVACNDCNGRGEKPKDRCMNCAGTGVEKREEEIVIPVPAAVRNGETLRMPGKGEYVGNGVPGDLYIHIRVRPHKVWRREGDDLVATLDIKLTEAVLGANKVLVGLDGKDIEVNIPERTSPGTVLRMKGKGIPGIRRGNSGDILIELKMIDIAKPSRTAKKLLEELAQEGF